jgi:lipopolysaccharide/colanic/teichoic acid biosynthesis glycosyltransferase
MRTKTVLYAFFDLIGVIIIFSFFLLLKKEPFLLALNKYLSSFLLFLGIWLVISLASNKYQFYLEQDLTAIVRQIVIGNLLVLGTATSIMFMIRIDYYSRMVLFGTISTATLIELIWASLNYYIRVAIIEPPVIDKDKSARRRNLLRQAFLPKKSLRRKPGYKSREDAILVEIDQDAFDFIFSYARIESADTLVISTTSRFNIDTQLIDKFNSVVNLKRINDIRYVNKFFESANAKLHPGGLFIDFVETKNLRKKRILDKYPVILNYIAYAVDYIIKRLLPKFGFTKGLYFFLTRGQNRVFSKAEVYGRLYSCGFEIIDEKLLSKHLFFVARKVNNPLYPENPSYGPFVKLERIGYQGKTIRVYKLRTMHPYAEYLQEYVYKRYGLDVGGKFRADFRISTMGKFLRMFWLDELPMLINLLRGDLKMVGVRPLSKHYFGLYSEEFQKRRMRYKPGLIPPFYVDKPGTLQEIMESEKQYLDAYDKHPFRTDFRYFFKAFYNILFRKYRSS